MKRTGGRIDKAVIAVALAAALVGCASVPSRPTRVSDSCPVVESFHPGKSADALRPTDILRAMTAVAEWQLAHPSKRRPDGWQQATFWSGMNAFAPLACDPGIYIQAIRRNGEGNGWKPGPHPFFADDYAITQSYFLLYGIERDPGMLAPTLSRLDAFLRQPFDETLEFTYEKKFREWVWCDSLFMMPPALALAADATGDRRYLDLMNRLWWKSTDYLYDGRERLFYRDSRFFSSREPDGSKVFWSRGNAWVLAGLARVLQRMPADYPDRHRFLRLYRDMAERIGGLQGGDGYWRASLLYPEGCPMPETSGTALFTYALAWGTNEGLLDRDRYASIVRKGWSALVRSVQPDGRVGHVQQEADRPGISSSETGTVFGAGAFLLAGSEVYRLSLSQKP